VAFCVVDMAGWEGSLQGYSALLVGLVIGFKWVGTGEREWHWLEVSGVFTGCGWTLSLCAVVWLRVGLV